MQTKKIKETENMYLKSSNLVVGTPCLLCLERAWQFQFQPENGRTKLNYSNKKWSHNNACELSNQNYSDIPSIYLNFPPGIWHTIITEVLHP